MDDEAQGFLELGRSPPIFLLGEIDEGRQIIKRRNASAMTNSVDSEDTKIAMVSVFENIIKWLCWRPIRSLFGRRSP